MVHEGPCGGAVDPGKIDEETPRGGTVPAGGRARRRGPSAAVAVFAPVAGDLHGQGEVGVALGVDARLGHGPAAVGHARPRGGRGPGDRHRRAAGSSLRNARATTVAGSRRRGGRRASHVRRATGRELLATLAALAALRGRRTILARPRKNDGRRRVRGFGAAARGLRDAGHLPPPAAAAGHLLVAAHLRVQRVAEARPREGGARAVANLGDAAREAGLARLRRVVLAVDVELFPGHGVHAVGVRLLGDRRRPVHGSGA